MRKEKLWIVVVVEEIRWIGRGGRRMMLISDLGVGSLGG